MPEKSWRIGVGTTTRTDPTARSATTSRLPCIIPMASPARHRERPGKTQLPAVQSWGALHRPVDSRHQQGSLGGQVSANAPRGNPQVLDSFINVQRRRFITAALNEMPDRAYGNLGGKIGLLELQVPGRADQGCRCRIMLSRAIQRDIQEPRRLCRGKPFSF